MNSRFEALVPLAVQGPFDLRSQLQQHAVIGLPGLGLDAQRQSAFLLSLIHI